MDPSIRVLIVAADPLVRSSLSILFDNHVDFEISDSASPANFFSAFLTEPYPLAGADLVLWDLGLEPGNLDGVDFQDFEVPIVALAANGDQAAEAWKAGSRAILSREIDAGELPPAVEAVMSGLLVFDPALTKSLLPTAPRLPSDLREGLTPRELEVLQLLATGLTNRAIAGALEISEHTVKFHVNSILNKLDVQSRTEAVVIATKLGFIVL